MARNLLEQSFPLFWVSGEVSNFIRAASGHWYFSLKDAGAQISCAMFGARKREGSDALEDGAKVRVFAEASVYEARGQLQIIVQKAERAGAGDLQAKFEALKRKLHAEGHTDQEISKRLKVSRNGKDIRPNNVVTFLSQRREAVDEAFAGDIIGFTTHGGVQLGDTITDGANLQFTGLPFFAPELFMTVLLKNPLRTKQLQQGLAQLGEEGAIQVFRPQMGGAMLLGAVGQLQFEVVQHRLKGEYDADIRLEGCQYTGARWITADTPAELRAFTDAYPMRMARDAADTLAFLCTSPYDVRLAQERFPKIHFHPLREHAGLALQTAG